MSPVARDVLRLGAYQLAVHGGAAPHAAVGETVSLAAPRERGFVNAILRKLSSDPPAWPVGDGDADVAMRTGMQPWAVTELRRLVGDQAAEAAAALAAHGLLCLRVNTRLTTVEAMETALGATARYRHPCATRPDVPPRRRRRPGVVPGFEEGWFAIQDQASAFVVRALDPRPGERVLDACAAPGGKAPLRRGARRRGRPRGRRPISTRSARRADPPGGRAAARARRDLGAGRDGAGHPRAVRPRARRRSVQRDRLGTAPARAALAAEEGARSASLPGSRSRSPRRQPSWCAPGAGSSTRSARSRAPRPTPRATRSSGTGPSSRRSRSRAPTGRRNGCGSGRTATGPTGCSWQPSSGDPDRPFVAGRGGYDTPRGQALRVDPVRRSRAPRRSGQAGRSACRDHPYRHHGWTLRSADRARHGGGRIAAAMHRPLRCTAT